MTIKQPEVQSKKYDHLIADIEEGRLKIPKFQRNFVWTAEQTSQLVDSVLKGYPIGTFILWKTREELRHYKDIGNAKLPEIPKGDVASYVLDGQQRITSLFAARKGLKVPREGQLVDFGSVLIDLSLDPESPGPLTTTERSNPKCISVCELLSADISVLAGKYPGELKRIDTYRRHLTNYDFSTVVISDYPIDIAVDVFTRINTSGTELTLFEIMVAKTYDEKKKFDLAQKYDQVVHGDGTGTKCLEDAGYETIEGGTILQCVSVCLSGEARRDSILKLDKAKFIDAWPAVVDAVFSAVDYFSTQFRIPVSSLLPYDALLVPLSYFFFKNGGKPPSAEQDLLLAQYFWRASLSGRFTSATESKLGADIKKMDSILYGKIPDYTGDEIVNLSVETIEKTEFRAGESFSKAVLCLYAYFEPKSFKTNGSVKLDNTWLKTSASRNFHHFFPKAFLRSQKFPSGEVWEEWYMNVIPNITLVDDYLNKREIGTKPPSVYLNDFMKANPNLDSTMKSHLIDNLDEFGIWQDDYDKFVKARSQRILEELNKRCFPPL